jgi:two-component system sensor histidine kinase DesK
LQLAELSQIARDALSQVRQSVSGYKHQGLFAEATKFMVRLREAGFETKLSGDIPQLDARRETAIILALTELSTNIIRHSNGDSCQLCFEQANKQLAITLSDNGDNAEINEGNGISGLRERLNAIGATLTIQQKNGVEATIRLPLKEREI